MKMNISQKSQGGASQLDHFRNFQIYTPWFRQFFYLVPFQNYYKPVNKTYSHQSHKLFKSRKGELTRLWRKTLKIILFLEDDDSRVQFPKFVILNNFPEFKYLNSLFRRAKSPNQDFFRSQIRFPKNQGSAGPIRENIWYNCTNCKNRMSQSTGVPRTEISSITDGQSKSLQKFFEH